MPRARTSASARTHGTRLAQSRKRSESRSAKTTHTGGTIRETLANQLKHVSRPFNIPRCKKKSDIIGHGLQFERRHAQMSSAYDLNIMLDLVPTDGHLDAIDSAH